MWSVMNGVGEAYFAAFALAIGLSEVFSGLVASLPFVTGAALQLVTPWAVMRLRSHKRWVVICVTGQALAFGPLLLGAALGRLPAWALFASVALYWGAGLGSGPAWNTWVGTIVPARIRARYFANRTRVTQIGILAGLVTGGLLLQRFSGGRAAPGAFLILFGVALVARLGSACCLIRQSEPVPLPENIRSVGPRELLTRRRELSVLVYMLGITAAVNITGPFFTPYMLKQLDWPYWQFMTVLATGLASKMIMLPTIGRFAKRYGVGRLLWVGGLGMVPLTGLWMVADSFTWLICVQVIAGVVWGCYEIATFLLLFDTIPTEERTSILTTFNLFYAFALVTGSLVGAGLLGLLGEQQPSYHVLFTLSMLARLALVPLLLRIRPPTTKPRSVSLRPLAVRASAAALDRPVIASMDNGGEESDARA
jgi:MFS family permease